MSTIRKNGFLKGMVWLLFFVSHIYLVFTFIAQPGTVENDRLMAGQTYYITASNATLWAEGNKADKSISQSHLISLLFAGSIFFVQKFTSVYRQLCVVYSCLVRIFNLSPCYLINRVLII